MKKLSLMLLFSINCFDLKPAAAIITNFGPIQISTDADTEGNRYITIGQTFDGQTGFLTNIGTTANAGDITIGNGTNDIILNSTVNLTDGIKVDGVIDLNTGASGGTPGVTNIATGSTEATDNVAVNISNLSPSITSGTLTKGLVSIGNISIADSVTLTGALSNTIAGINIGTIDCDVILDGNTSTNTISAINIGTNQSTTGTNAVSVINIGEKNSTASTSGINIGTGSAAYAINIGNATGGGAISLNSKSSNISMITTTSGDITATAAGNVTIKGSSTNATNINVDTAAATVTNIGTGTTTGAINIGNATGGGAIALNSVSNNISMTTTTGGDITATAAGNITIKGSSTNATNINVDTAAATVTNIGTGTTTGAINIGNATGGGNISLISSGTNSVGINVSTGAATVTNIGTGTTTGAINIGNATGGGAIALNSVANNISMTTTTSGDVSIASAGKITSSTGSAAGSNDSGNITFGTTPNTGAFRTGLISLSTGTAGTTTRSGNIELTTTGVSGTASVGDIILTSGNYGIVKLAADTTNGHIKLTATADIDLPSSGLSPISIDSSGNITTDVSSIVFKKDIENLNISKEDFQKLRVVSYNMKDETKNKKGYKKLGLIAEELMGTPLECAIIFGKDGKPHSIDYQTVFIALLYRFLEAQKELDLIKNSITNIQSENANIKENYENIEREQKELKTMIQEIIMELTKKNS